MKNNEHNNFKRNNGNFVCGDRIFCLRVAFSREKIRYCLTNAPTEKPKRIFTVGCTVKWNGELFEIKKMTVGEDNQTDAVIKNDRAMLCVPIDDLEAVEE